VGIARKLLGADKLLGVTVHNAEEMREAQDEGADYVSVAPVFTTPTKPDHQEPLGLEGLKNLVTRARVPVVAIGGINPSNVSELAASGLDGVCVVSGVMSAPDPEKAARELYLLFQSGRGV